MYYPTLRPRKRKRYLISRFGGYDHRPAPREGSFCEMRNLSGQRAPHLCVRGRRLPVDRLDGCPAARVMALGGGKTPVLLDAGGASLQKVLDDARGKPEAALAIENLEIDFSTHSVKNAGKAVQLTDTEYAILEYLLHNRGTTVTTPVLYEAVWKERFLPGSGNTVMVHVLNLRRKIEENPSSPKIIRTVWGKGYQID